MSEHEQDQIDQEHEEALRLDFTPQQIRGLNFVGERAAKIVIAKHIRIDHKWTRTVSKFSFAVTVGVAIGVSVWWLTEHPATASPFDQRQLDMAVERAVRSHLLAGIPVPKELPREYPVK